MFILTDVYFVVLNDAQLHLVLLSFLAWCWSGDTGTNILDHDQSLWFSTHTKFGAHNFRWENCLLRGILLMNIFGSSYLQINIFYWFWYCIIRKLYIFAAKHKKTRLEVNWKLYEAYQNTTLDRLFDKFK